MDELDTVTLYSCPKGNYSVRLDSFFHNADYLDSLGIDTILMWPAHFNIGDIQNNSYIIRVPSTNREYRFDIVSSAIRTATERDFDECFSYMEYYSIDGVTFGPVPSYVAARFYLSK